MFPGKECSAGARMRNSCCDCLLDNRLEESLHWKSGQVLTVEATFGE